MNSYQQSKKARYIASVVYVLIMSFIVGGTYFSQQEKAELESASETSAVTAAKQAD